MWNKGIQLNQFDEEGKKHGTWKHFFTHSNAVSLEENFLHGIKHGLMKYFWGNGELKHEGKYEYGKQIGLWKYYLSSSITQEIIYIF